MHLFEEVWSRFDLFVEAVHSVVEVILDKVKLGLGTAVKLLPLVQLLVEHADFGREIVKFVDDSSLLLVHNDFDVIFEFIDLTLEYVHGGWLFEA